jgi:hypothetical protein
MPVVVELEVLHALTGGLRLKDIMNMAHPGPVVGTAART